MTELDFPNLQGFVVRGYRLPAAGYIFLRIEDPARARALLADVIPQVITAERWDVKPDSGINVALSYEGLRALGLPEATLAAFPPEFRAGMASRAELLGDVGDSAPEHWEDCFRTRKAHVLVMISAKDGEALAERDRRIREAIARAGGVTAVVTQVGSALPTGREHFGYADGFSQPAIEGSRFPDPPERARPSSAASGGRSAPASSSSATPTSRARCPPRRRPTSSAATAPMSSTASCARTSPPSGASCARPPRCTRARRSSWPPSSSAAGATARRSTPHPIARTRRWWPTSPATTPSTTVATRAGCAARSARTSAA